MFNSSTKNVVKARRLRAQIFLACGSMKEAEEELADALATGREVGNPPQLWKTHAAIGDLRCAQGRAEDARQAYGEAFSVIERVAASLADKEMRDTFLRSEHVEAIRRQSAVRTPDQHRRRPLGEFLSNRLRSASGLWRNGGTCSLGVSSEADERVH